MNPSIFKKAPLLRGLEANFRTAHGGSVGRRHVQDMLTFDRCYTADANGNQAGVPLGGTYQSRDGRFTYDSTGAFLVGELERLDQTLHMPLVEVSWGRDIDLREDVTIADEVSSYTLSQFASAGGLGMGNSIGNGKSWMAKNTTQVTGVSLDISKATNPLHLWGQEIKYSIPELESAARVGRPVDAQKYEGMQLKHQMDIDEQVYIGDTSLGDTGLVNNTQVTPQNFPLGAAGFTQWTKKTPDEILADVNTALTTVWQNSAWAVVPSRMGIPPAQFGYISTAKVSNAGNISILRYIMENNLLTTTGKGKLEIYPMKFLLGAGAGGTIGQLNTVDRMVVYTKNKRYVRFPMTLLARTPVQFDSIWHKTTYYCRLGRVEVVYPETVGYFDGL